MKDTSVGKPGGRTWIFQSDPDVFELDSFLRSGGDRLTWEINQHKESISDGDTVFLWRPVTKSLRNRAVAAAAHPYSRAARSARLALRSGIVAVATVDGSVFRGPDESAGASFRTDLALPEARDRVWLNIVDIADGRGIVRRRWLMNDPICHDMTIINRPSDTNLAVAPRYAERLTSLWNHAGKQLSRADIIAVLECCAAIQSADPGTGQRRARSGRGPAVADRQARAKIDSIISDTAVMTGRAVDSIKLAIAKLCAITPGYDRPGLKGASSLFHSVLNEFKDPESGMMDLSKLRAEFDRLWKSSQSEESSENDSGLLL